LAERAVVTSSSTPSRLAILPDTDAVHVVPMRDVGPTLRRTCASSPLGITRRRACAGQWTTRSRASQIDGVLSYGFAALAEPPSLETSQRRARGAMAQLVARLHGMQKVRGSNPLSSTEILAGQRYISILKMIFDFLHGKSCNWPTHIRFDPTSSHVRALRPIADGNQSCRRAVPGSQSRANSHATAIAARRRLLPDFL
jgi:hypothetical protein